MTNPASPTAVPAGEALKIERAWVGEAGELWIEVDGEEVLIPDFKHGEQNVFYLSGWEDRVPPLLFKPPNEPETKAIPLRGCVYSPTLRRIADAYFRFPGIPAPGTPIPFE